MVADLEGIQRVRAGMRVGVHQFHHQRGGRTVQDQRPKGGQW